MSMLKCFDGLAFRNMNIPIRGGKKRLKSSVAAFTAAKCRFRMMLKMLSPNYVGRHRASEPVVP